MRKTKIICTLGPATDRPGVLRDMMLAGMDVARLNFSHSSHEDHLRRLNQLKQLRTELGLPVAAMMDTRGPEVRLKTFQSGSVLLAEGDTFTLTARDVPGDQHAVSITYSNLYQDVRVGTTILLDDGLISLRVQKIDGIDVVCSVLNGGRISDRKGVNVPGIRLGLPFVSNQDREDILFAVEQGFDFIAASFTRCAQDILEIRRILDSRKCESIRIIAKLENSEGVDNIEEILSVADGVMVARGDMGVEIDFAEIPVIQKNLIKHCYSAGKPAITATQMLDSMMQNPRPTRAEITDVANAIYDGTSAIMLSGETAAGKYPVEAVRTMAAIAQRTESDIDYDRRLRLRGIPSHLGVADAVAHAACTTAMDIGARAIVTVSKSGETARLLCKYRPQTPIIACVISPEVYRQLSMSWGITPLIMPTVHTTDELLEQSVALAQEKGYLSDGDLVVITAGVPVGISGTTNMIKAHLVGHALVSGTGVGRQIGRGRLCLCRNEEEARKKFCPGDVLVAPATGNDMLPQMREAAAIITEEPGQNSHAAIVGLTLGKPVIVGVQGAMRKLRDGQQVSVDSERGIVQALPD